MPFANNFAGPFPPTPENVWLAILLGLVFGSLVAIMIEMYFQRKFKKIQETGDTS